MHQEVIRHQNMLDRLFDHASELEEQGEVDDEVRAHLTQYLCVRASGYVEFSVKTILREYVKSRTSGSGPHILNYVNSQLKRTLSPRRSEVLKLIGNFSSDWKEIISDEIKEELETSLTSIVANRNNIAHGEDVTLSLNDMKIHFQNAKKVVEIIDRQCLPPE